MEQQVALFNACSLLSPSHSFMLYKRKRLALVEMHLLLKQEVRQTGLRNGRQGNSLKET